MNLFAQIQESLVDEGASLAGILLKCKLLAARLGSQPLQQWIVHETDGYPVRTALPDYREWRMRIKGHFFGPFGTGIRHAPVPEACIPQEFRESVHLFHCRQSVASLESTLRGMDSELLTVPMDELALLLGTTVYEDQNCAQAWGEFPKCRFVEVLNAVRGRLLDFTIALEKESPAVATGKGSEAPSPERVSQIFNVTVQGPANVVGQATHSALSASVACGSVDALREALSAHGMDEEDLDALVEALAEEPAPREGGRFGPRVSRWIGGMIGKAAQGTWEIGVGVAGDLLARAISHYYGLPR
ncbi:MAG: hypothetical protein U0572_01210 [Phycisphaerales bacterium]